MRAFPRQLGGRSPQGPPPLRPGRVRLLALLYLAALGAVVYRLYDLQIRDGEDLAERARRQQERLIEVPAERGAIVDRQGAILALTVPRPSIYALPGSIDDVPRTARRLAKALGLDRRTLQRKLQSSASFVWVARGIDRAALAKVEALGLEGIASLEESHRTYPRGTTAGHLLGFAGVDNVGLEGLELAREEDLRGRPGRALVGRDAFRRSLLVGDWVVEAPTPGANVVTTLDEPLQFHLQRLLDGARRRYGARSGGALVMDVHTGEVLAMASSPPFDPNRFKTSTPETWRNRVVTDVFEPGSSFKVVPLAAALEAGLVTPETRIRSRGGKIRVGTHDFRDWKVFGDLTVRQVLANSSNVGTIRVALMLGPQALYEAIRRYGFGERRGIDLPGEAAGLLKPPESWSSTTIGAVAIGQEISVSLLQLASLYAAIGNGGYAVTPFVTRGVFRGDVTRFDEHRREIAVQLRSRVRPRMEDNRIMSAGVARQMRELLAAVVEEGTGHEAALAGYRVGGKTGTAQKIDPDGHYSKTRSIHSFVGLLPIDRPQVVIAVVLDEPRRARWASKTAAPLFRDIAWHTVLRRHIPGPALARTSTPAEE